MLLMDRDAKDKDPNFCVIHRTSRERIVTGKVKAADSIGNAIPNRVKIKPGAKAREIAQSTNRLVIGETKETVPKYQAVSGVVKRRAPMVREIFAARVRKNLRQSLCRKLPLVPSDRVMA